MEERGKEEMGGEGDGIVGEGRGERGEGNHYQTSQSYLIVVTLKLRSLSWNHH